MATKAEKKLAEMERMIASLEKKIKQEKENHEITKKRTKLLTDELEKRDLLTKYLREELHLVFSLKTQAYDVRIRTQNSPRRLP